MFLNMIASLVLQCSSDTTYPVLATESTFLRSQFPTRLRSLETPVMSLRVPRPLTLVTNWLQIQEDSQDTPPNSTVHEYDSQNSRKWYTHGVSFIIKNIYWDQPNERDTVRGQGVSKCGASMPTPPGICVVLAVHWYIFQPGSWLEPWCAGLIGVSVCRRDWKIGHVVELSLWPYPYSLEVGLAQSPDPLITSLVFWWQAPILNHPLS